jgi:branched-chain amino acid transport system substrate-binding protein
VSSVSVGTPSFVSHHTAAYGEGPGPFAAQGYDALNAILLATKGLDKPDGETVAQKLSTTSFTGMSGNIAFDQNGDVAGNYDVYVAKQGKFVLQ